METGLASGRPSLKLQQVLLHKTGTYGYYISRGLDPITIIKR
jgi:hypothetical protein